MRNEVGCARTHKCAAAMAWAVGATIVLLVGARAEAEPQCDANNAGLRLPSGFCALEVSSSVGAVRNLAVASNGDIYAALRSRGGAEGGVLAMRDRDGDGRADEYRRFGRGDGHGVALGGDYLYYAAHDSVVRWRLRPGQLAPSGDPEVLVDGFPEQRSHRTKAIALGPDDALYVSVGAPSNACQKKSRTRGSPGIEPCPQRELQAGIWRYSASKTGQRHRAEARIASGMRHTLGLAVHPETAEVWGAVNGRDQLATLWGFDESESAELPAEELVRVAKDIDLGWPYCYHDGRSGEKVLSPEYGGDGNAVGDCADKTLPDLFFPAHWAPMALAFYDREGFPASYRGGLFIAFRGSWNRAPLPQEGFRVVFAPFDDGLPLGGSYLFATSARDPNEFRMTGVAVAPDGSLLISADANGRIWRVLKKGAPPKRR